ncbi:MAG TPA: FtsH protease activity modulator HflK, partial [Burkholderiales bacterium]|nr:FtsH protease activity modulator HflK [Burkholderiales bacterium]
MSLNDPQWGNKGGGNGPPDLDELWRNFNQKLSGLFGRKGGGGGSSTPPPSMRQIGGGAGLLAVVVLAVWLASGFYTVNATQRGVVFTFGKYTELTNPGLRWRLPFPIQTEENVDLSTVRTIEIGYRNNVKTKVPRESIMLTGDENIIDIQFAVQYTVKDPLDYLFTNKSPDETVRQVAESAFREVVGANKMDFVLYEGREQVANDAQKMIQNILDLYKTGIAISNVTMQNAQPPEEVQASFDDAVKAKQDLERQKNEGQAYFNDVVPRAQGAASRLTEEAQGYRQSVLANAEGEASRFKQVLAQYDKAPQVTRERMYLETVQQMLSSTSKILLDTKGSGNLLYLPLDKIMQMSAGALPAEIAAPSKQTLVEPTPNPDSAARSREALRSR